MPSRRPLPKVLTREDAARLLAVPNVNVPTGLRNRCALELMYRCGLRVGEACGVHVRDVKWGEGLLHLRPENTKGNKEAYVPIPDQTMAGLERWKYVRQGFAAGKTPHLLTTLKGTPVTRFYVYRMVARCAERAGIGHVHPHMLRHTFATEALQDGINVAEVQQLLRHSDISTTMIYAHVALPDLKRKMASRGGDDW